MSSAYYEEPKRLKPTFFGPYLILQTLGQGEFAKVKAGVHVQTKQDVAIKLMKKETIIQDSLEIKLEREISILKSVQHPHIVRLFEVLTVKNYIGIVLQRAAGGELFDYILKHHYLQEHEAKRLFAQLISGVQYMHQKHIVHRDLKLENLLLSKDRDIIITDFGFANRFSFDLMETSCGSPCYAAPELVIKDQKYVGTAADIWSCGVILFAMLCGYLPFDDDPTNPQGANINALYKYIISTPLQVPKSMSPEATDLLSRMLVPDPTKRCTMNEIINHIWLKEHYDLLHLSVDQLEQLSVPHAISPIASPPPTPPLSNSNSTYLDPVPRRQRTTSENLEQKPARRNRTTSETYTCQSHQQPLYVLPSVSEQSYDTTKERSKSQKLMEWFTKHTNKFATISGGTMFEKPASPIQGFHHHHNEPKLKLHRGAIDQDALTSKPPMQVLESIKASLTSMGIEIKQQDFKFKCIRPSNKKSFFFSSNTTNVLYGETGMDSGQEVQFSVELAKIENLPGLYVVDMKRIKGNIWAFKFLYHTLLELLDLRQDGY